ncbi:hypothetical protein J421_4934 (plasmid) [Gemmatirosa kalamazoonensis]|uniref:Uncharacterized protein n=1 Tax=Gemmatirosa kalamazoonensis TaxID=861299 RepID=W0RN54_9BACT|nr:hypothetical protein [Gemmatirosa kalamazoonensis]AHG92469.1 hypothetical protein J421_4934 [Gemmatirosa kalamazoonensis]
MPPRLPAVRWPTLLLLASIGLTALGLLEATRAVRRQREVAEHALRDYAGFAAWSYAQHVQDAIGRATSEALGAVNHGEGVHTSHRIPPRRTSRTTCHGTRAATATARATAAARSSSSAGSSAATRSDSA